MTTVIGRAKSTPSVQASADVTRQFDSPARVANSRQPTRGRPRLASKLRCSKFPTYLFALAFLASFPMQVWFSGKLDMEPSKGSSTYQLVSDPISKPPASDTTLPEVAVVMAVLSSAARDAEQWRASSRATWLDEIQNSKASSQVAVHFLISGCPEDKYVARSLQEEYQQFNDLLFLYNATCTYASPREATHPVPTVTAAGHSPKATADLRSPQGAALEAVLGWLQWVQGKYRFLYAAKVDDGVYVRGPLLLGPLMKLAQRPAPAHLYYAGHLQGPAPALAPAEAPGAMAVPRLFNAWTASQESLGKREGTGRAGAEAGAEAGAREAAGEAPHMSPSAYVLSAALAAYLAHPPLPLLALPGDSPAETESRSIGACVELVLEPAKWTHDPHVEPQRPCPLESATNAKPSKGKHAKHPCEATWKLCRARAPRELEAAYTACKAHDSARWGPLAGGAAPRARGPGPASPAGRPPSQGPPAAPPFQVVASSQPLPAKAKAIALPAAPSVAVVMTGLGPRHRHAAIHAAFRAQHRQWGSREIRVQLLVADASPYGPSPVFAELADPDVVYSHVPGMLSAPARRNFLVEQADCHVIMHWEPHAYYAPPYITTTLAVLLQSQASLVKLGAWFVYRRTAKQLQYVDTEKDYYSAFSDCHLGSLDQRSTHRFAHTFSLAYPRALHQEVQFPADKAGDEASCYKLVDSVHKNGHSIALHRDTSGLVLHLVDRHTHADDVSTRINAQYNFPDFFLPQKFPGIASSPWLEA